MTDPKVSAPITTISGKYYAGMKKAEAQKNDSYKKMVGIDFRDIDKNKDGVLSPAEICDARDKEVERARSRQTIGNVGLGVTGASAAIASSGVGAPVGALVGGFGFLGMITAAIGDSYDGVSASGLDDKKVDLDAESGKTAIYRKEHGLDTKW